MSDNLTLSIDAMGGDNAPDMVVEGVDTALERLTNVAQPRPGQAPEDGGQDGADQLERVHCEPQLAKDLHPEPLALVHAGGRPGLLQEADEEVDRVGEEQAIQHDHEQPVVHKKEGAVRLRSGR